MQSKKTQQCCELVVTHNLYVYIQYVQTNNIKYTIKFRYL